MLTANECWTCPSCTLVNPARRRRCDACKSRQPLLNRKTANSQKENFEASEVNYSEPTKKRKPELTQKRKAEPIKKRKAPAKTSTARATKGRTRTRRSTTNNEASTNDKSANDHGDAGITTATAIPAAKISIAASTPQVKKSSANDSTKQPSRKTDKESRPKDCQKAPTKSIVRQSLLKNPAASGKALYRHVIAGWHDTHTRTNLVDVAEGEKVHPVVNPASNKPFLYYQESSNEALEHTVQQAAAIQERSYQTEKPSSSQLPLIVDTASWWSDPHQHHRRANVLAKIGELLETKTDLLVDLEVRQIGRPRKELLFLLSKIPECFIYYASLLRVSGCGFGNGDPPFSGGEDPINLVRRVPLGVVAQIVSYPHPLLIAVEKLAPALAAGNCVILKPSEQAPASIIELALLCRDAGLPEGVLSVILGGKAVEKLLVDDPRIHKVDFLCDPSAGNDIRACAGKNVCGMTPELRGTMPLIVFAPKGLAGRRRNRSEAASCADNDIGKDDTIEHGDGTTKELDEYLDPIVHSCAFRAFISTGIVGTRLLVQRKIYSLVCKKLIQKIQTVMEGMGDPLEMTTTFGPMINEKQMNSVHSVVTSCTKGRNRNKSLELLCGGKRYRNFNGDKSHLNEGNWYEPTLLAFKIDSSSEVDRIDKIKELHHTSPLFQSKLCGPVLGILPFEDEEHAIHLANDSPFRLGCSIWTDDMVQAHSVANKTRAGIIRVNDNCNYLGWTDQGAIIGRDNGIETLMEYSQSKRLVICTKASNVDWFKASNTGYN